MYIQMSKVRKILFLVSCWLTTFVIMFQLPQYVVTNDLYIAFADQASVITALISFPSLLTALASLAGGALLQKVSTKFLLIVAGTCSLFMAVCALPNSAWFLFVCTMICAVGAGFANTAGMAILCEVFTDQDLRAKQMGIYNGMMAAIGGAMSYIAGITSMSGWQGFAYVYWISIPMLVMTILFLPSIHPKDRPADNTQELSGDSAPAERSSKGFGIKFWLFFISMSLFFVAYVPASSYVSVYIAELGGSASLAGTITSLGMILGIFTNMAFGLIYTRLHRKISVLILILDIAVVTVGCLLPSKGTASAVCICLTLSYGQLYSLCYAYAAEIVPPEKNGMAMGLMTFCYSIAVLIGVYFCNFLLNRNGGIVRSLPVYIVLLTVVIAIELFSIIKYREKETAPSRS